MIRRPPRATRTYTLFPYTTLFRSRAELLGKAREFTLLTATSARQRLTVPDVSFAIPPEINVASLGEIVKTDANASIEALRDNAAIDREEIDLLWWVVRSEEHTSELQSLMRISYAVFCLKKKK